MTKFIFLFFFKQKKRGIYGGGGLQENVKWVDLRIGDIVYLKKGDIVPADIILLDTG